MPNPQWLDWARRFQAIAQIGLAYCKDPYDRQRYEEIQRLAADIMTNGAALPDSAPLLNIFKKDLGYATPKIDIRTAVFDRDRILLVQEREDGLWTLPAVGPTSANPQFRRRPRSKRRIRLRHHHQQTSRSLRPRQTRSPAHAFPRLQILFSGTLFWWRPHHQRRNHRRRFLPRRPIPPALHLPRNRPRS